MSPKTGLDALVTPEDSVLLLIDHQPAQFANLNSHEPTMIINNVVGLAKLAKAFGIPTILTSVLEERGGLLVQQLQDVFPDQKPINRTTQEHSDADSGDRHPDRVGWSDTPQSRDGV
jgi:nicotinamidase-related amidase